MSLSLSVCVCACLVHFWSGDLEFILPLELLPFGSEVDIRNKDRLDKPQEVKRQLRQQQITSAACCSTLGFEGDDSKQDRRLAALQL